MYVVNTGMHLTRAQIHMEKCGGFGRLTDIVFVFLFIFVSMFQHNDGYMHACAIVVVVAVPYMWLVFVCCMHTRHVLASYCGDKCPPFNDREKVFRRVYVSNPLCN